MGPVWSGSSVPGPPVGPEVDLDHTSVPWNLITRHVCVLTRQQADLTRGADVHRAGATLTVIQLLPENWSHRHGGQIGRQEEP